MTDKRAERNPSGEAEPAGSDYRKVVGSETEAGNAASNANADMQVLIGRQLRAVYDDIAKQPVPDRFIELMKQLDVAPASR